MMRHKMGIFNSKIGSYDLINPKNNSLNDPLPVGRQGNFIKINSDTSLDNNDEFEKVEEFFTKNSNNNFKKQIQLSKAEEKLYYEPSQKVCESYFKALKYFLSAEDHLKQKLYKMVAKEIQKILVDIFLCIGCKDEFSKIVIILEKINEPKIKASEQEAFKSLYFACLQLCSKYAQIADNKNFHYWYKSIDLNYHLSRECENKQYIDRLNYYSLTPSDGALYSMFVVPFIGFHMVVFSIAIPPIGNVLATTKSFATITGILASRTVVKETVKSIYNVFKKNQYYIPSKASIEINSEIKSLKDLEVLKKTLSEIKKMTARNIGGFNFYFTNSFKYYCELKENCEKFRKFGSSFYTDSFVVDDKIYQQEIPKIRSSYYKTLYYTRSNKIVADTLRIQLEALKLSSLQSVKLLTNHPQVIGFFKSRDIFFKENVSEAMASKASARDVNTKNIIYKYLRNKYNKVDDTLAKQLTHFVFSTMSSEQINLESLKEKRIDINRKATDFEEFKKYFDDWQNPADISRRMVGFFANIPCSQNYFAEINKYSYEINVGSWFAFSIFEAMLYASNSNAARDKYQKIRSWCGNIANGIYLGHHVLGIYDLFSRTTGLFSNSVISNLAFSPFGILIDVAITNLGAQVSSNEAEIWKDIEERFVKEKEKSRYQKDEKLWDPAYRFFSREVGLMPSDSIHKISDMFRKRLVAMVDLSIKINSDIIDLIDKIKNFEQTSKKWFTNKVTEEFIIKRYTKIIMNMITLTKELEAYDFYLENIVKNINEEIDQALKFYLILISVEHRAAFSIIEFAKHEKVFKKFFVQ